MASQKRKAHWNEQHWNENKYSLLSTKDENSVPVYFQNDTSSVRQEDFSYLLELLTFMHRNLPGKSFLWLEYLGSSIPAVLDLYQKKTVLKKSSSIKSPAMKVYVICQLGSYNKLSERYRHFDRKRERSAKSGEIEDIIKEVDDKKEQIERKKIAEKQREQSPKPIRSILKRKGRGDARKIKKVDIQLKWSSIIFFEGDSSSTTEDSIVDEDSSEEVDILDVPQYYGDVSIEIDGYSLLN